MGVAEDLLKGGGSQWQLMLPHEGESFHENISSLIIIKVILYAVTINWHSKY